MPTSQQVMGLSAPGWRVHPLHNVDALGVCSCQEGKQCKSPGKHPRIKAWQKAATTDEEVIDDWWTRWPRSNVAVVMGPSSGIIDLDCDSEDGEAFIRELFSECEEALETPTFRSARGRHRLYKYTSDLPNSDKGHWKIQGVDVDFKIGNGGLGTYCVFPPSLHANGALYHWEKHPDDYEVLELPDLVIARLHAIATEGVSTSKKGKGHSQEHFERILDGVCEGERNESAASLIGNAIACMKDPTDSKQLEIQWRFIESWNAANNKPPLDVVELKATFRSIVDRHNHKLAIDNNLDFLREKLQIPNLREVICRGVASPSYELVLCDGKTLELGAPEDVDRMKSVRLKLLSSLGVNMPYYKQGWPDVVAAIILGARKIETGDNHIFNDALENFLQSKYYTARGGLEPESPEWWGSFYFNASQNAYGESGCVWAPVSKRWCIDIDSFCSYLHSKGLSLKRDHVLREIQRLEFKKGRESGKHPHTGKRSQPWKWFGAVGRFAECVACVSD